MSEENNKFIERYIAGIDPYYESDKHVVKKMEGRGIDKIYSKKLLEEFANYYKDSPLMEEKTIGEDLEIFIEDTKDYIKLLEHQEKDLEYNYRERMMVNGATDSLLYTIDKSIETTRARINECTKIICRLQQILLKHVK